MLLNLQKDIKKLENKKKAKVLAGFFKTGEGEYGFGDVFLGIPVPECRKIALKYRDLNFEDILTLLRSEIHEERLIALLILVHQYQHDEMLQRRIYEFYLKNTKFVNNWDLVDTSADKIVGAYIFDKPRAVIYKLAKSSNLWERRIAMISTFYFIKNNQYEDALGVAEVLIADENDLIQKAVGWMLREVGNRDLDEEKKFLKTHYKTMGRTALRYAIEKFPEKERIAYLEGKI